VIFTSLKNHCAILKVNAAKGLNFYKNNSSFVASSGAMIISMVKAVTYYRVSTKKQGKSGLGLEAQKEFVDRYVKFTETTVVKEYFEIESGKKSNRPILKRAVRYCKKHGLTLIIAKIDRLARNAFLVSNLIQSGVKIVAADKPFADPLELLEDAINAQRAGETISKNTKDALQAAKRRGVELGKNGKVLARENRKKAYARAEIMIPMIEGYEARGFRSEGKIMVQLNLDKVPSARGGQWGRATTHAMLKRVREIRARGPFYPIP